MARVFPLASGKVWVLVQTLCNIAVILFAVSVHLYKTICIDIPYVCIHIILCIIFCIASSHCVCCRYVKLWTYKKDLKFTLLALQRQTKLFDWSEWNQSIMWWSCENHVTCVDMPLRSVSSEWSMFQTVNSQKQNLTNGWKRWGISTCMHI